MQKNKYEALKFLSIGLELAVTVMAGLFLGYYADRAKGTFPYLTVGGATAGIIFGFYILLKRLGVIYKK